MVTFIQNNLDAELRHPSQDCHHPRVRVERESKAEESLENHSLRQACLEAFPDHRRNLKNLKCLCYLLQDRQKEGFVLA